MGKTGQTAKRDFTKISVENSTDTALNKASGQVAKNTRNAHAAINRNKDAVLTGKDDPIGIALRRLHEEVVAEPIPDEFLDLLAAIDRKLDGEHR